MHNYCFHILDIFPKISAPMYFKLYSDLICSKGYSTDQCGIFIVDNYAQNFKQKIRDISPVHA